MSRSRAALMGAAAVLAVAIACSKQSASPTSPSSAASGTGASAGVTLKTTTPAASSPAGDQAVTTGFSLTATAATPLYGGTAPGPFSYRFQIFNEAGAMVADSGQQGSTTYRPTAALEFKKRHTWRVRAEYGASVSEWSNAASFISPEGGYIRGNEVFDPLTGGSTVGQIMGPATWMGADGIRLDTVGSYVRYLIPQTINTGEFSMYVKGLRANAPGDKSKVFGMMEGEGDYITNRYRVDVQYRGTGGFPPNSITYRVLYGDADDLSVRYEPTTDTRMSSVFNLDPNTWYYWQYTWGTTVRVAVRVGGPTGQVIYDVTRNSRNGSYNPQPHYAFIGTPTGRSGAESASIPGTIYKNVWIGPRTRPDGF